MSQIFKHKVIKLKIISIVLVHTVISLYDKQYG